MFIAIKRAFFFSLRLLPLLDSSIVCMVCRLNVGPLWCQGCTPVVLFVLCSKPFYLYLLLDYKPSVPPATVVLLNNLSASICACFHVSCLALLNKIPDFMCSRILYAARLPRLPACLVYVSHHPPTHKLQRDNPTSRNPWH
jgi:hypothetical protein